MLLAWTVPADAGVALLGVIGERLNILADGGVCCIGPAVASAEDMLKDAKSCKPGIVTIRRTYSLGSKQILQRAGCQSRSKKACQVLAEAMLSEQCVKIHVAARSSDSRAERHHEACGSGICHTK